MMKPAQIPRLTAKIGRRSQRPRSILSARTKKPANGMSTTETWYIQAYKNPSAKSPLMRRRCKSHNPTIMKMRLAAGTRVVLKR